MPSPLKKPQSNEEDINQQLYNAIYKKVTKNRHSNQRPKKKGDGTIAKCIGLFNKGADPNILIQLEKLLREQEEYQKYYRYYIDNFLPALKKEVMGLEVRLPVFKNEIEKSQGSPTGRGKILEIISVITNKNSDKNHSNSTIQNQKGSRNNQTDRQGNVMGLFKKKNFPSEVEIPKNSGINPLEKDSLAKGVSEKGTPGTYNTLRSSGYYGNLTTPTSEQSQERKKITQSQLNSQSDLSIDSKDLKSEKPNITVNAVEVPSDENTSKLSSSSDLDSGINSSSLASSSRRNSLTSVTSISSEESVHLKLNPAEKDNSLQLEDEGKTKLAHPNKTRPKGPSGKRSPSKHHEKIEDQVKKESSQCVILEPVHNLFRSKAAKARTTICRLVLSFRSQFFHNRLHFCNQAKDLSTTHLFGNTTKVCNSFRFITSTVAPIVAFICVAKFSPV